MGAKDIVSAETLVYMRAHTHTHMMDSTTQLCRHAHTHISHTPHKHARSHSPHTHAQMHVHTPHAYAHTTGTHTHASNTAISQ